MPQSTLTDDQRAALLGSVLTVPEVCARYHLKPSTVLSSIHLGYIRARRSGSLYLLLVEDCDRRWGHRREEPADE